jgi:hypothetical protein
MVMDGAATVGGGGLEVPGQKLSIGGINGTIPFSVMLKGGSIARQPATAYPRRENYGALLKVMQQAKKEGEPFTIEKVRFGALEFGNIALTMKAGNGLVELTSLRSELYEGSLMGRGYFRYHAGIEYGSELLLSDVSLRKFCDSYPAIKGYISGRVDGIITLVGKEAALAGVTGGGDLWTRSREDEKMLVSKEFLQKLAGKNLKGIFFRSDRPYDRGEIKASVAKGYLTFHNLDIEHTGMLGVKDLSVSVAPVQNRIAIDHLIKSIKEAAARGKASQGGAPEAAPPATEFKWQD